MHFEKTLYSRIGAEDFIPGSTLRPLLMHRCVFTARCMMRLISLLRSATKHVGSLPPCGTDGQMSAVRVVNSSQQCFATLETQSATCSDPNSSKVLITGSFNRLLH